MKQITQFLLEGENVTLTYTLEKHFPSHQESLPKH